MANGRMSEFAQVCSGQLQGEDKIFTGISIDTRSLEANNLFVAIEGPNFDAHDFLDQAQSLGAAGFVLTKPGYEHLPQVRVADSRKAMGAFAAHWRQRFSIPLTAITGSNGKTSTKEILASICSVKHRTLATSGNMNNDIGVPLTLFRLKSAHAAAVIEIGTNGRGEIAYLTSLVKPTVGMVINASFAHLAGLGDVRGVAEEKGALLAGLDSSATAVINADDEYAAYWRDVSTAGDHLEFGSSSEADVSFSNITQSVTATHARLAFTLSTPLGSRDMVLPMAGVHNVRNAAAAAAAAIAMGLSLDDIEQGLAQANGVAGRMQIQKAACGARIIDDSYNSNPASARAAIDFLAEQKEPGWLVLGDMGELGSNAPDMHASIGKHARAMGVEKLLAVGKYSRAAVAAFGEGANWFETVGELQAVLDAELGPGINILVKGSRSMHLERITLALKNAINKKPGANSHASQGVGEC